MKKILLTVALFALAIGCAAEKRPETTKTATETQPQKTEMKSSFELTRFVDAFNGGDSKTIASMYAPNAVWTMANGTDLPSAELEASLGSAFESGAGDLKISDVSSVPVGEQLIVRHQFSFAVGEVQIDGIRTIVVSPTGVVRDVWVPSAKADQVTESAALEASSSLDKFFNAATPGAVPYVGGRFCLPYQWRDPPRCWRRKVCGRSGPDGSKHEKRNFAHLQTG